MSRYRYVSRIVGPDKIAVVLADIEAGFAASDHSRIKPGRDFTWEEIRTACREQIREALRTLQLQSLTEKKE
jgi:hypothetical protein